MSGFQARLKKLGTNWKKASARDTKQFAGSEIEDGRYIAAITLMEINESMSSGRLQCHIEYSITDGPETGTTIHSYDGLETEDGLFYFQRKLAKLGVAIPDDPAALPDACARIEKEKPIVRIRVKTKGEFQNTYIDKLLGEGAASAEPARVAGDVPAEPGDEGGGDEGGVTLTGFPNLAVGDKVQLTVKGKMVEGVMAEIIDTESFKATVDKKTKLFTVDQIVPPEADAGAGAAGPIEIEEGDKVQVTIKGKPAIVTITKIVDDESFKATTPEGKEKLFTVDMIIL